MRVLTGWGLAVAMALAVSACSQNASTVTSSGPSAPPAAAAAGVTKILVIVVENHSLDQMRAQMPYTFGLAEKFGYASNYFGVAYPSLPNYLAIASGSTSGVHDDDPPSAHLLHGTTVFDQAVAHGKTAAVYADGMPSNCAASNGGDRYAVKHNPWPYFTSARAACRKYDLPASRLADAAASGKLPNAGLLVPNLCNDAHDCPLSVADQYIKSTMRGIFAGPDWASGHLAVVITADTDDRKANNRVLTAVIHPSQHNNMVTKRLDHYSLSRLFSQVAKAQPLQKAAGTPSMSKAFNLPIR